MDCFRNMLTGLIILTTPRKKSDVDGVAPVKTCPQCGFITHISAKVCPSCAHVFPVKTAAERRQENLIKLSEESPLKINVNALINIGKLRGGMFMPTHSR